MDSTGARRSYLSRIEIVTPTARFALGGPPRGPISAMPSSPSVDTPDPTPATPRRQPTLASEAMRWTYVLRSRERWKSDAAAVARQEQSALDTLHAFGLDEGQIDAIANAGQAMVEMPFTTEGEGWEGRIFPWEAVIGNATRRFRHGAKLTLMRHLRVAQARPARVPRPQPRVLLVQSQPSALEQAYDMDGEAQMVRRALGVDGLQSDAQWRQLKTPTLAELASAVAEFRPEIVHIAGCDNHQGVRLIRERAGAKAHVWVHDDGIDRAVTAAEFLETPRFAIDGLLMRSDDRREARATSPEELGRALTLNGQHRPYLVSLNLQNSAARMAPLLLAHGALAAIGFQDAIDDALAEYFFEALYGRLRIDWHLPQAFDTAWAALRAQTDLGTGTGVALWGAAPLVAPAQAAVPMSIAPVAAGGRPVDCRIKPKKELNYAVLHNHGPLFDEFELRNNKHPEVQTVHVLVELHCGSEKARYASALQLDGPRTPLRDAINIPLTATLMRSVSEAVMSSLYVEVTHGGETVVKDTFPLRLLPVDQWLDNAHSGQWLPSFVLPRDPAVEAAVTAAQRYVRVIRDDPTAGFEGYQNTDPADPESLEQVDLQVEAIWAALLHEWQLGYINPPPTYADTREGVLPLDSQRLRTPSNMLRVRMGTCIDLALLFAACLELVDIYPVIFLLDGHALPGYWRHHDYQAEYREVRDAGDGEAMAGGDERRNSAPGTQTVPWKVGKSGYRELRKQIRAGRLVPIETVRLTEHSSFREALKAGVQALVPCEAESDFDSVLDIITARRPHNVTPLPILGD